MRHGEEIYLSDTPKGKQAILVAAIDSLEAGRPLNAKGVAANAGVSEALIFKYFRDMAALEAESVKIWLRQVSMPSLREFLNHEGPGLVHMSAVSGFIVKSATWMSRMSFAIFTVGRNDPLRDTVTELLREWTEQMAEELAPHVSDPEGAETAATAVAALLLLFAMTPNRSHRDAAIALASTLDCLIS